MTTLNWWPVGINSVLPGNFFGDNPNLRYKLTLTNKQGIWVLVDSRTPAILRAFHTNGTGGGNVIGTSGNGYFAWKLNPKTQNWTSLPYRYKTISENPGRGCWIILEDELTAGQIFVRDIEGTIELALDNGNSMVLGAGSIVPVSFLEPTNFSGKKYKYGSRAQGFVQVSSNIPIKLIDIKGASPVTYAFNPKARSWTVTSRSTGKLQTRSVPSRRRGSGGSGGGGLSGLVLDILDIAGPVQGYHDPNYDFGRSAFNPDGTRNLSRELRNRARFGVPYDPTNLGEKARWEAFYGPA